jgi:starvation-inducible DNA-binding protein
MNLEFALNDMPERTRTGVVALLNQQLADGLDLSLQAKQAHWNVKGPHFSSLHPLFDQVAEALHAACDVMAERAVQLGGIAEGTSQAIVRDSRLPAYELDLHCGSDHVRALAVSLARFAASTREAIRTADQLGDAGTADVFTQTSRTADTLLWKVSVQLGEGWGRGEGGRVRAAAHAALSAPLGDERGG